MGYPYSEIILITAAIALAFLVAYWLISIQSVSTSFENIQLTNQAIECEETYYVLTIIIENKGTTESIIEHVLINGNPPESYNAIVYPDTITVKPGEKAKVTIKIPKNHVSHGETIKIKFITAKGFEFPILTYIP